MKKFILALVLILAFAVGAEAGQDTCLWVWNIDVGTATSDTPDEVHCSLNGRPYISIGTDYIQNVPKNSSITVTTDLDIADASTTSAGLVSSGTATTILQNENVMQTNILGSANCNQFDEDTSGTDAFYHVEDGIQDESVETIGLTPIACFKVTLGTETDSGVGTGVVWTRVTW